ncbi:hypothetical protein PENTCL1PPCAC_23932 [Pristionchus entomophagus]|uniref:Anaphase-promoting complex subunit 1 n=1 Tax=Pristionchus entomophagus TaxID=358040 RepID=A0AAV5U555_9BILA|nr:hypothetical protein PENTCL1PPCAC_23932 [Pristionchus entomophagus]
MLVSAAPKTLHLDLNCDASFIDEQFLKKYSQSVLHPNLSISCLGNGTLLRLTDDLSVELANFESLKMPSLEVNTDWLIPAILERLRLRCSGWWSLLTTRRITTADIDAALGSDMKHNEDVHSTVSCIKITGTDYCVTLRRDQDLVYIIFERCSTPSFLRF